MYIYTPMALQLLYCLTVVMENVESVGIVEKAITKFLKDMYVYHSVRKPGYVFELSAYRDNLYRCLGCKRLGKGRYLTVVNEVVVASKKHPEDDHVCELIPVAGMLQSAYMYVFTLGYINSSTCFTDLSIA